MNFKKIAITLALLASVETQAKQSVPADVQAFVNNAESCQHFAGEWDSGLEPARKGEIERSVDRYCQAAQRQLKSVTAKYRHDAVLRHLIARHRYDAVVSYRK